MTYNTKQKDAILNIIYRQEKEFTIKDIYKLVKDSTGLTTIYRLVDKLVEEGRIKPYIKDNIIYYQYLEECNHENHFYLKCEKCGSMTHIDCDCINELSEHIKNEHKFQTNKENIIMNGLCNKCNR